MDEPDKERIRAACMKKRAEINKFKSNILVMTFVSNLKAQEMTYLQIPLMLDRTRTWLDKIDKEIEAIK